MSLLIRRLRAEDDRAAFVSGNSDLDRFFHRFAGQNQFRHHIGVTYVAVLQDQILGFATLAAAEVEIDRLPKAGQRRLPRYPLPVLRIARLAVALGARDLGIGRQLLRFALALARKMSQELGCIGVLVDAKPEAVAFYRRYGFEALEVLEGALAEAPEPVALFLPLSAIPAETPRLFAASAVGWQSHQDKGLAQGGEQGLEQGALSVARTTLLRLLERKFGKLTAADEARIEAAGLRQLTASVMVPASASARRTEVRLTQLPAEAGVPSAGRNDNQGSTYRLDRAGADRGQRRGRVALMLARS